jgi:predicted dehydrogenase
MSKPKGAKIDRREFMGRTAAVAAGVTILKPRVVFGSQANSAVRLGLLGCGGRGSGVTASFIEHTGAVLTAIGDAFPDQLDKARARLDEQSAKFGKPAVNTSKLYKGLNAYQALFADKDVDAVYIATPPWFHPMHLEAAIGAGKHIYLEKPVAVDVPGAKTVVALGEKARAKKLSLAVGFQIRHASPYVELAKRVHAGEIGTPVSARSTTSLRRSSGPSGPTRRPRRAGCATGSTTSHSRATSSSSRTSTSSTSRTGC